MEEIEKIEILANCVCMDFLKEDCSISKSFVNENFTIYGDLQKDSKILIKYTGKLVNVENMNKKIFINLGFGNMWEDRQNILMAKCTHSDIPTYCAPINISSTQEIMICFMDENNDWDLKNSSSYIIPILKEEKTIIKNLDGQNYLKIYEGNPLQNFFKKLSSFIYKLLLNLGKSFENIS